MDRSRRQRLYGEGPRLLSHPSPLFGAPHASCLVPQVVEMDLRVEMVREWHSRLQGLLRLHIDSE